MRICVLNLESIINCLCNMRDVDAAVNVIHVTCAGQGPLMVQRRQDCYNILSLADTLIPALQLIGREFIAFSAGA